MSSIEMLKIYHWIVILAKSIMSLNPILILPAPNTAARTHHEN
jgi:hypothetical protein